MVGAAVVGRGRASEGRIRYGWRYREIEKIKLAHRARRLASALEVGRLSCWRREIEIRSRRHGRKGRRQIERYLIGGVNADLTGTRRTQRTGIVQLSDQSRRRLRQLACCCIGDHRIQRREGLAEELQSLRSHPLTFEALEHPFEGMAERAYRLEFDGAGDAGERVRRSLQLFRDRAAIGEMGMRRCHVSEMGARFLQKRAIERQ